MDTAEVSIMRLVPASQREALEFFAVGPDFGPVAPGRLRAGNIMFRVQDTGGTFGSFAPLARQVPTGAPGGPLGSSQTRTLNAIRISAAAAGPHTYVCVVDEMGHLDLAERRGQPAFASNGAAIPESSKWAVGGNVGVIWQDLNLVAGGAPSNHFVDVACAASQDLSASADEIHILGVTDDGRAWHSLANRPWAAETTSSFSPFGLIPTLPTDLTRVTAAANEDQLHVVALSKDQGNKFGQPWHVVRTRSGSWSSTTNVRDQISNNPQARGLVDVAAAFCNEGVVAPPQRQPRHLNVALLVANGSVDMTVHTSWSEAWGPGGASGTWLHGSQWDGALDVAPGALTPTPQVFVGITMTERPFPPT